MFRNEAYLISKGMNEHCRPDVFWVIGNIYDELMKKEIFDGDLYTKAQQYIDQADKEWNQLFPGVPHKQKVLVESIASRCRESFGVRTTKKKYNENWKEQAQAKQDRMRNSLSAEQQDLALEIYITDLMRPHMSQFLTDRNLTKLVQGMIAEHKHKKGKVFFDLVYV